MSQKTTRSATRRWKRGCLKTMILINPGTLILAGLCAGPIALLAVFFFIIVPRLP